MEGKFELQFENNEYCLVDGNTNDTVATTDKVLLKEYDGYMKKLSLKNCQAIENGYDLDELAENSSEVHEGTYNPQHKVTYKHGFIDGFQKAIEILGDKKFSEKDMSKAWSEGYHRKVDELNGNGLRYFDKFIQSLQQTEWDVVVEMDIDNPCPKCGEKDNVHGNYDYSNITRPLINTLCNECGTYFSPIPKLDADGCLILKRK